MATKDIRQRTTKGSDTDSKKINRTPTEVEDAGPIISVIDILRIVFTLIAAALAGSYYLTSGESFTYGYKPPFTSLAEIKQYFQGPLQLTPAQLAQYDGKDPTKPIYMAINGTIYDVSASPQMYGPGGGYSVFSGRDATRAFITGCFAEDRTHDMRGAELVYMPIDDPKEDISPAEKKLRTERERREALKKVDSEILKWQSFYGNSQKYFEVGKVVGLKDPVGRPPRLCATASRGRPKRQAQEAAAAAAAAAPPVAGRSSGGEHPCDA